MKSVFRSVLIVITMIGAALISTGCAPKQAPPAEAAPAPAPALSDQEMKDLIVARVNGTGITMKALVNMENRIREINRKNAFEATDEANRKRALDELIFQELSLQEAARRGLRAEEKDVQAAITALAGHSDEEYQEFLAKQKITDEELRSDIRRRIVLRLIYTQEIMNKISVTDDDVRKEYERDKDRFSTPEKVTVTDVVFFLKLHDPASLRIADAVLARIKADKDRDPMNLVRDETFMTRSSVDLDKEKDPVLYDAAVKLKEGELSDVIKTDDGFHILKLTQYIPRKQRPFEEVAGVIKMRLTAVAQSRRFVEWGQEMRKGAKIEIEDLKQKTGDKKQESGVRSQETGDKGQGAEVKTQESGAGSQESGNKGQGAEVKKQEPGEKSQGTENKKD